MTTDVSLSTALNTTASRDGGKPRLTLYGPQGEYSDISSTVFRQWVAKTGNYMVEELQLEPGDELALRLPHHWLSVVITTAAAAVGLTTTDTPDSTAAVFSTSAIVPQPDGDVSAVNLAPLARSMPDQDVWWDSDFIHDVRASADAPLYEGSTPAVSLADAPERVLFLANDEDHTVPTTRDNLTQLCDIVWQGHSVVLVTDPKADLDRICAQEHVTRRM